MSNRVYYYPHHHPNPNLNRYGRPRHAPDPPVEASHMDPDRSDMPDRDHHTRYFRRCPMPGCEAVNKFEYNVVK